MFGDIRIQRNSKYYDTRSRSSYGSTNPFSPALISHPNAPAQSANLPYNVDITSKGTTTPYDRYEGGRSTASPPFGNLAHLTNRDDLSLTDSAPTLNYVSQTLRSDSRQVVPLNPTERQRYNLSLNLRKDLPLHRRSAPAIIPRGYLSTFESSAARALDFVDVSHPKLEVGATQKAPPVLQSHQVSKPLRKRVRSEHSTESTSSHSYKFSKTSEGCSGSRVKGRARRSTRHSSPDPRSKRNRFRKSSSPKNLPKRGIYNMHRLDLGPCLQSTRHTQELRSRLKAVAFNEKSQTDGLSLVVPSLPITLTPSTDIPKSLEQ